MKTIEYPIYMEELAEVLFTGPDVFEIGPGEDPLISAPGKLSFQKYSIKKSFRASNGFQDNVLHQDRRPEGHQISIGDITKDYGHLKQFDEVLCNSVRPYCSFIDLLIVTAYYIPLDLTNAAAYPTSTPSEYVACKIRRHPRSSTSLQLPQTLVQTTGRHRRTAVVAWPDPMFKSERRNTRSGLGDDIAGDRKRRCEDASITPNSYGPYTPPNDFTTPNPFLHSAHPSSTPPPIYLVPYRSLCDSILGAIYSLYSLQSIVYFFVQPSTLVSLAETLTPPTLPGLNVIADKEVEFLSIFISMVEKSSRAHKPAAGVAEWDANLDLSNLGCAVESDLPDKDRVSFEGCFRGNTPYSLWELIFGVLPLYDADLQYARYKKMEDSIAK
ncbi:hypothetical protein BDP27DRAFT_1428157 [Rhodocollybia butyracea]|uniref:Uncharacterized protein n=1 Tax=Rhodocollybia butyracea TaxID=206335 RepID=A0A9P5U1A1_9AGAR|nr:hypothetical protein BDP27DRAFT_1428157 [Rhodocollybia butyracea]